jgi:hypothetical protein
MPQKNLKIRKKFSTKTKKFKNISIKNKHGNWRACYENYVLSRLTFIQEKYTYKKLHVQKP